MIRITRLAGGGVPSCGRDADCPTGQRCDVRAKTCVPQTPTCPHGQACREACAECTPPCAAGTSCLAPCPAVCAEGTSCLAPCPTCPEVVAEDKTKLPWWWLLVAVGAGLVIGRASKGSKLPIPV